MQEILINFYKADTCLYKSGTNEVKLKTCLTVNVFFTFDNIVSDKMNMLCNWYIYIYIWYFTVNYDQNIQAKEMLLLAESAEKGCIYHYKKIYYQ
jgi:cytochrome c oxidase assembly factor CtaG